MSCHIAAAILFFNRSDAQVFVIFSVKVNA